MTNFSDGVLDGMRQDIERAVGGQITSLQNEVIPRLVRIEQHAEKTNGRITRIELEREREKGAAEARAEIEGRYSMSAQQRLTIRITLIAALSSACVSTIGAIIASHL